MPAFSPQHIFLIPCANGQRVHMKHQWLQSTFIIYLQQIMMVPAFPNRKVFSVIFVTTTSFLASTLTLCPRPWLCLTTMALALALTVLAMLRSLQNTTHLFVELKFIEIIRHVDGRQSQARQCLNALHASRHRPVTHLKEYYTQTV